MPLQRELLRVLNSPGGERTVHNFLKRNSFLVKMAFSRAWNANICIPEFRLGSDFRSDSLVLCADSGLWHASFIELKSPVSRLYTNDGTPLKTLRNARKQVQDYGDWIKQNESYLRQTFSKILREHNEPAQCSSADRHTRGDAEIVDPRTCIDFKYHIVIGRRRVLNDEERARRSREYLHWGSPETVTYDRLVDMARRRDEIAKGNLD